MPIQVTQVCQQKGEVAVVESCSGSGLCIQARLCCWLVEQLWGGHLTTREQGKIVNCWPWFQIPAVPSSAFLCLDTEQTCEHKQSDWPCRNLHRDRPQMVKAQARSKGDSCPLTTKEHIGWPGVRIEASPGLGGLESSAECLPQPQACGWQVGRLAVIPGFSSILRNRFAISVLFEILVLLCDLNLALQLPEVHVWCNV